MDSLPYIISWVFGGVLTTTAHAGIIYHVHLWNNYDVYMKVSPYKKSPYFRLFLLCPGLSSPIGREEWEVEWLWYTILSWLHCIHIPL